MAGEHQQRRSVTGRSLTATLISEHIIGRLYPAPGANRPAHRVGRGHSAGGGKQAGRGQSGQRKRSRVRLGFEGGQNPWYRRLPKRGFNPIRPTRYEAVSLTRLAALCGTITTPITPETLRTYGVTRRNLPAKILANGTIDVPLHLRGIATSARAAELITQAGGSIK